MNPKRKLSALFLLCAAGSSANPGRINQLLAAGAECTAWQGATSEPAVAANAEGGAKGAS